MPLLIRVLFAPIQSHWETNLLESRFFFVWSAFSFFQGSFKSIRMSHARFSYIFKSNRIETEWNDNERRVQLNPVRLLGKKNSNLAKTSLFLIRCTKKYYIKFTWTEFWYFGFFGLITNFQTKVSITLENLIMPWFTGIQITSQFLQHQVGK